MTVIAIDPGLHGAVARLSDDGLLVEDMPNVGGDVDAWGLSHLLLDWGSLCDWQGERDPTVYVEKVHSMPKQGVASTFKFGVSYGAVLGVVATLELPVVHVTPTTWTRWHKLGADKGEHRKRAMETWPQCAALFRRVKDDGRADAALIAAWGAKQ